MGCKAALDAERWLRPPLGIMPRTYSLPKSRHLRLPSQFEAAYAGKTRESRGPLTV
jgi:hypothetical protein